MSSEDRPPGGQGPGQMPEEEVLVVPRIDLERDEALPAGFSAHGWERLLDTVRRGGVFRPRSAVEEDPSLKQVIPYAVVCLRDRVFLLRRTTRGGESRLHRKLSIGVGGHINPEGVPPERLVEAGLHRELSEELCFDQPYAFRPIGLINDDGNAVGRVHVGIVYLVEPADGGVRVRETEVLEGGFVPIADLGKFLPEMESWSKLVAEGIFGKPV